MDSPRGRIYQVLQVDQGRLPIGDPFVTHIDRCLGCLGCQTACPSGVQYGAIVERARAQIEQHYRRPFFARMLRNFFILRVLPRPQMLAKIARLLRWYQGSIARKLMRGAGVLRLLNLEQTEALAPSIDRDFFSERIGTTVAAEGKSRGRVVFHAGCIQNVAFSSLNDATVRVLARQGIEVAIFSGQSCCGALQAHSGYREAARALARENIVAFERAVASSGDFDAIVTNAAGCGSHLKDYADLLTDDAESGARFSERARSFCAKVKDVTEYLDAIGVSAPEKSAEVRVTYQDPCHLAHGQRIRTAPRALLQGFGCEIVEMQHADLCCGSAGTYNVTQNEISMKILAEKMEDLATVAPRVEAVVTANVGCMLQLRAGIAQRGWKLPVKHVIEVLDEAGS